jgi:ATP-dependent protease ClpP protease subunit
VSVKKIISIIGPIGSFTIVNSNGEKEQINGIQLVDVVAQVTKLPADTKELDVEIGSPGGSVAVAKLIRGFLKGLQSRMTVTTKQVDDIASSGTILFSSGQKRLAAKGINPSTGKKYQFMVHNPWTTHASGNADELQKDVNDMRLTEEEMVGIYQEDTGIDKDAMKPLMTAESFFDADKAVDLKLATGTYEALNKAAYNPNQMAKDNEISLVDQLKALLGIKKDNKVATAPPAELTGKAVMIDGKAAVDGVYTVVGGVITALAAVPDAKPADPAGAPAGDTAMSKKDLDEVIALIKSQKSEADIEKIVNEKVAAEIVKIKKGIKTEHVPVGFTPETKADDAKEWDRSFKAGEHVAMRKDDPEKWTRLYYAKYGKMPSNI